MSHEAIDLQMVKIDSLPAAVLLRLPPVSKNNSARENPTKILPGL